MFLTPHFFDKLGNSIKDEAVFETLKNTGLAEIAQPPQEVAQAIKFALQQDHGVAINEVVIRPTAQATAQSTLDLATTRC